MRSSWAFFRYTILNEFDEVELRSEHIGILASVKGVGAPYRVRDPSPADFNNFLMQFREEEIDGEDCAVFVVGHTVNSRLEHRYNEANDRVELAEVPANDMRFTNVLVVPRMGMTAAKEGSGDRLSANSGMGRLRSIVEHVTENSFTYERTARHEDVVQAMNNLVIEEFNFEVRPFNPHPSNPGLLLDEMMKKAKTARLQGKAFPLAGQGMNNDAEGLVSEAVGLSEKGYGQFGLKGRTSSGAHLTYQKPKMQGQTIKDIDLQDKPTNLKITVPVDDDEMTEHEYVIRTMKELFDG